MVAAGCDHATSNIRLIINDMAGNLVDKSNGYGRSTPSVNVHLTSSGQYAVNIYSFDALEFDYNLSVYASQQSVPILDLNQNPVSVDQHIPAIDLV